MEKKVNKQISTKRKKEKNKGNKTIRKKEKEER